MSAPTDPKGQGSKPATREVYRLTDAEIEELREKSRKSSKWAKQQLAIDSELKHLGPAGGWPHSSPAHKAMLVDVADTPSGGDSDS